MAGPTGAAGVKHGKSLMSEATGALNASMLKVCRPKPHCLKVPDG